MQIKLLTVAGKFDIILFSFPVFEYFDQRERKLVLLEMLIKVISLGAKMPGYEVQL